ncbi:hypothetical protein [Commensalibacter nepenthis]|uniref:Uncharacterized protein n=1 Tax=Commensalibacter nepenthis TaxID=3043872 RepID=A0ABT6Q8N8_9PROT|nr:hypothetical protein [Commensalibacter sp. TBRC 10068]MDI2113276.1 hypothetical protein [Commensalibacter sp. TBRC 10068]
MNKINSITFLFYDPYYTPIDDNFYIDDGDDTLVFEGSLLVTKEAL